MKLDRAAMKLRDEMRRAHPRDYVVKAEARRIRRALRVIDGS